MTAKEIKYFGTETAVQIGDLISTRVFFIRRQARVVYLPGVSKMRSSLEHDGLQWVGLQELRGPFLAALVDPNSNELDKRIHYIQRGDGPVDIEGDPFVEPGDIDSPAEEH